MPNPAYDQTGLRQRINHVLGLDIRRRNLTVSLIVLLAMLLAGLATWLSLHGHARYVMAGAITSLILLLSIFRPALAVTLTLIYLAFLGEVRRLLLYFSSWSGFDPLQMVGPSIALLLFAQLVIQRRVRTNTLLAKLVLILMLIMAVQILNPLQGGFRVGIAGAFFYIVPLAWFWIGRSLIQKNNLDTLLFVVVPVVAGLASILGLWQALVGFLPHQQEWIDTAGYSALWITATKVRSYSFFTSGQEYAAYLGIAVACVMSAAVVRRNPIWLLPLPLLLAGIFVQGSRGPMLSFALTLATLWAVKSSSVQLWVPRLVLALAVGLGAGYLALSRLTPDSFAPQLQKVADHQISGLTNPLDQEQSTAATHASMKWLGIKRGILAPWGQGLGATTMAAGKFGSKGVNSEVDLSNVFISLGAPGGVLYLGIILCIILLALRTWAVDRHTAHLAIGGILSTTIGQWLGGAMYSIVPIVWLLIGYLDRHRLDNPQVDEVNLMRFQQSVT